MYQRCSLYSSTGLQRLGNFRHHSQYSYLLRLKSTFLCRKSCSSTNPSRMSTFQHGTEYMHLTSSPSSPRSDPGRTQYNSTDPHSPDKFQHCSQRTRSLQPLSTFLRRKQCKSTSPCWTQRFLQHTPHMPWKKTQSSIRTSRTHKRGSSIGPRSLDRFPHCNQHTRSLRLPSTCLHCTAGSLQKPRFQRTFRGSSSNKCLNSRRCWPKISLPRS